MTKGYKGTRSVHLSVSLYRVDTVSTGGESNE